MEQFRPFASTELAFLLSGLSMSSYDRIFPTYVPE